MKNPSKKNKLFCALILLILSSCKMYDYKTIDAPKKIFKSPIINLDDHNLVSTETKFYIYDSKNKMFSADNGNLKDSLLQLNDCKKLTFSIYSAESDKPVKITQDETHIFVNKGLNLQNLDQTIMIRKNQIDSIHKFERRRVPKNDFFLKERALKTLFDRNGFSKNIDKWKFLIQDMDDSTFECTNVSIYDSTLSALLTPKKIKNKLQLGQNELFRKNEVLLNINLRCTNKNTLINLKPNNILGIESYMTQKDRILQKGDLINNVFKTILTVILSFFATAIVVGFIAILNFLS